MFMRLSPQWLTDNDKQTHAAFQKCERNLSNDLQQMQNTPRHTHKLSVQMRERETSFVVRKVIVLPKNLQIC